MQVRRGRRLVLQFICTLANYEYAFQVDSDSLSIATVNVFYHSCCQIVAPSIHCKRTFAIQSVSIIGSQNTSNRQFLVIFSAKADVRVCASQWMLGQDGSIKHEVKLTGQISTHVPHPEDGSDPKCALIPGSREIFGEFSRVFPADHDADITACESMVQGLSPGMLMPSQKCTVFCTDVILGWRSGVASEIVLQGGTGVLYHLAST